VVHRFDLRFASLVCAHTDAWARGESGLLWEWAGVHSDQAVDRAGSHGTGEGHDRGNNKQDDPTNGAKSEHSTADKGSGSDDEANNSIG
jgi:hypothetical protein